MYLNGTMSEFQNAHDMKQYSKMRNYAQNLGHKSGTLGLGRIYLICRMMVCAFDDDQPEKMLSLYPSLIESIIEFKIYIRTIISPQDLNRYFQQSAQSTTISKQFRLEEDEDT